MLRNYFDFCDFKKDVVPNLKIILEKHTDYISDLFDDFGWEYDPLVPLTYLGNLFPEDPWRTACKSDPRCPQTPQHDLTSEEETIFFKKLCEFENKFAGENIWKFKDLWQCHSYCHIQNRSRFMMKLAQLCCPNENFYVKTNSMHSTILNVSHTLAFDILVSAKDILEMMPDLNNF